MDRYHENLKELLDKLGEMREKSMKQPVDSIDFSDFQINIEFNDLSKFYLEWNVDTVEDLRKLVRQQIRRHT